MIPILGPLLFGAAMAGGYILYTSKTAGSKPTPSPSTPLPSSRPSADFPIPSLPFPVPPLPVPAGILYNVGDVLRVPASKVTVPGSAASPQAASFETMLRSTISLSPGAMVVVRVTLPAIINPLGPTLVQSSLVALEAPGLAPVLVPQGIDVPVTLSLDRPVTPVTPTPLKA